MAVDDPYTRAAHERLLDSDDGWVRSRFEGRCSTCGRRFHEGTPIRRDDSENGWRAACCSETLLDE